MNLFSLTPLGVATSTVSSWLADDSMVLAAQSGVSIGADIYEQLDSRMTHTPSSVMVAYEQAAYFLALAVRRALREGTPTSVLTQALSRIGAEAEAASDDVSWMCRSTGYGCPSGGSVSVLNDAIDAIEAANLPQDDEVQLLSLLKSNRWGVQVRQAVPVGVAILSGLAAGAWWYHKRRSW
jgi:hypothetical protein